MDLAVSARERHEQFVKRVVSAGKVWALKSSRGWYVSSSGEDASRDCMPFWSDKAYAKRVAAKDERAFEPVEIWLPEFVRVWLENMNRERALVGTNWNGDLCGYEIEPLELRKEIEAEVKRAGSE